MARIANVVIPSEKQVQIALRYIYGIGPKHSAQILAATKVDPTTRVKDLTEDELKKIRDEIDANFTVEGDLALLRRHRIDLILSKNSGGTGAMAKIIAARHLGLPVIMIQRPAIPQRPQVETIAEVIDWLGHGPTLRGV